MINQGGLLSKSLITKEEKMSGKTVELTEERRGQIALALLRNETKTRGYHLTKDIGRNIGNVSKATGISAEELKAFAKEMITNAMNEFLK
jgi:hypothetical protein